MSTPCHHDKMLLIMIDQNYFSFYSWLFFISKSHKHFLNTRKQFVLFDLKNTKSLESKQQTRFLLRDWSWFVLLLINVPMQWRRGRWREAWRVSRRNSNLSNFFNFSNSKKLRNLENIPKRIEDTQETEKSESQLFRLTIHSREKSQILVGFLKSIITWKLSG